MKTSNKILLGSFFTAILIMVSLHVALYAKYKRGDYTLMTDNMWPMDAMVTHSIKDVKYISLNNIENIDVRASDTSKIQYEKAGDDEENKLSFTQKGDTLFVLGGSKNNAIGRWYKRTELLLAGDLPVFITNAQVHVMHSAKLPPLSLDFKLDKSFIEFDRREEGKANYGIVKINAINQSRIDLKDININLLDINLYHSSIEERNVRADSINISTDAASEISLSGQNLVKAKLSSHE